MEAKQIKSVFSTQHIKSFHSILQSSTMKIFKFANKIYLLLNFSSILWCNSSVFFILHRPNSKETRSYGLHFDSFLLSGKKDATIIQTLYPHTAIDLKTVFIYGKDFKRGMNVPLIPTSALIAAGVILLFICFAAIILHTIRRKLKLPGNDYVSSLIDCWIPFVGGGNVRMHHKYERCFFGVLYFSAFLIVSMFGGDLVDNITRILNAKVSTFQQVAEIQSPIYINSPLNMHSDNIQAMIQ